MQEYHKIETVFKRNPENLKKLVEGDWANPVFGYLSHNKWVFTEKVDGTNIRVIRGASRIHFGGKTESAQIPATLISYLEGKFLPLQDKFFEMFPEGSCLYGEGYGAKIQKGGGNYRQDQSFALFDILVNDPENNRQWWLERNNVEDVASKLNLDVVPIIGKGALNDMVEMTKTGFTSIWGEFIAEGIVARPEVELKTRSGNRVITKVKHKDF